MTRPVRVSDAPTADLVVSISWCPLCSDGPEGSPLKSADRRSVYGPFGISRRLSACLRCGDGLSDAVLAARVCAAFCAPSGGWLVRLLDVTAADLLALHAAVAELEDAA